MVMTALKRRYPIKAETIKRILEHTDRILSEEILDADTVYKLARIVVEMEKQNQADEHLRDKNERLDSGRPTEHIIEYHIVEAGSANAEDAPKADRVPEIDRP